MKRNVVMMVVGVSALWVSAAVADAPEASHQLVRVRAQTTQSVGQGTFNSGFGHNASVVSSFDVSSSLDFETWSLFASASMILEYTEPNNRVGRRVTWFDPSIGAQYPLELSAIDTTVVLSGGIGIPVSHVSRAQGSIGSVFVRGLGTWQTPVDGLRVRLGLGARATPSLESLRSVDDTSDFDDRTYGVVRTTSCQTRSGENSADVCGAIPSPVTLQGRVGVGYVLGDLSFDVDLAVLSFVSAYGGPDDAFTSANARSGTNATTLTSGSIATTYQAATWLTVSGGVASLQPIQTADGKGMRFPFWNFSGAANNFSTIFVSTAFRY